MRYVAWIASVIFLVFWPIVWLWWNERSSDRPTITTTTTWRPAVPRSHVQTLPPAPYDWDNE